MSTPNEPPFQAEPADHIIDAACDAWRKSRRASRPETASEDEAYFRENWRSLPGLRAHVTESMGRLVPFSEARRGVAYLHKCAAEGPQPDIGAERDFLLKFVTQREDREEQQTLAHRALEDELKDAKDLLRDLGEALLEHYDEVPADHRALLEGVALLVDDQVSGPPPSDTERGSIFIGRPPAPAALQPTA